MCYHAACVQLVGAVEAKDRYHQSHKKQTQSHAHVSMQLLVQILVWWSSSMLRGLSKENLPAEWLVATLCACTVSLLRAKSHRSSEPSRLTATVEPAPRGPDDVMSPLSLRKNCETQGDGVAGSEVRGREAKTKGREAQLGPFVELGSFSLLWSMMRGMCCHHIGFSGSVAAPSVVPNRLGRLLGFTRLSRSTTDNRSLTEAIATISRCLD